jgi:hypothetical protein
VSPQILFENNALPAFVADMLHPTAEVLTFGRPRKPVGFKMSESKRQVLSKCKARSRLSNGHVLPRSVDLRSQWARRLRDLLALHLGSDLADSASESEKAIIRRACVLTIACEQMDETFALRGYAEPSELELYQRLANSARRLFEAVGLQRRAKDVTPTLGDIIRADQERERQRHAERQDDLTLNGNSS